MPENCSSKNSRLALFLAVSAVWMLPQLQSASSAFPQDVVRRIDFRDGSSFEVAIPNGELTWKNIAKDGKVTERKVPIGSVKNITLVKEPSTARVSRIRNLLAQLGSENYHKRLEAQIKLTESGKEFEQIIEQYVPDDEETKWRIAKVKEHLKEQSGATASDSTFDVLVMKNPDLQLDGELALGDFQAKYGSSMIEITREKVVSISDEPLKSDYVLTNNVGGGKREQTYPDANGTMPAGMNFIGFENLPNGKEIDGNMDISRAYAARGVLFATSFKDSYVGTQMYTFTDGRGGNFSIANVEPTYQGVITISFCVPGNERFAAGTKYVGFNVSHVNQDGTFFEAYDAQDQLITKFTTDASGTDYLGFSSEVPIAKVMVRPNVEVDEDFAIDDLFFATPTALLESGNPDYFSVVTTQGERLQGQSVTINGDSLKINELSFGLKELAIPLKDIWVLIPPGKKLKPFTNDSMNNYCYCLTRDGSILLADLGSQKSVRVNGPIQRSDIVAFWGINQQLSTPPTFKVKAGAGALFYEGNYVDLEDVKIGKEWIASPSIAELAKKVADQDNLDEEKAADLTKSQYVDSRCIYLGTPPKIDPNAGVVYTFDGERYFLTAMSNSVRVTGEGIEIVQGEAKVKLAWNEVRSVRFPQE